jgi:RNA polymerase sigma-70 factor (ECF subfamily)
MTLPDLKPILNQVVEGDTRAFRKIFDLFSPKVHAFALKLTRSQSLSEEIVQEVFVKIWISRSSLASINYFPSYLYTVARNHTFNVLKKIAAEHRAIALLSRELSEIDSDCEEETARHEAQRNVFSHALDQLPPQQRLVYSLCHQKGLKYEEAARELNISRLTVKTHMQKALRSIKSHLKTSLGFFLMFLNL